MSRKETLTMITLFVVFLLLLGIGKGTDWFGVSKKSNSISSEIEVSKVEDSKELTKETEQSELIGNVIEENISINPVESISSGSYPIDSSDTSSGDYLFTQFVEVFQDTTFNNIFSRDREYSLLVAPDQNTFGVYSNLDENALESLVGYNIIAEPIIVEELIDGQSLTSVTGKKNRVTILGDDVFINGIEINKSLSSENIVILEELNLGYENTYQQIKSGLNGRVSAVQFLELVELSSRDSLLKDESSEYTIFVPSDIVMAYYQPLIADLKKDENRSDLVDFVNSHIFEDIKLMDEIVLESPVNNILGQSYTFSGNGFDGYYVFTDALRPIGGWDFINTNGVIHMTGTVLYER